MRSWRRRPTQRAREGQFPGRDTALLLSWASGHTGARDRHARVGRSSVASTRTLNSGCCIGTAQARYTSAATTAEDIARSLSRDLVSSALGSRALGSPAWATFKPGWARSHLYVDSRAFRRSGRPPLGDLRDSRWAGVRTCFQLPAVLTTPANRASPSQEPASPPAVTRTRSQSQTSSSQRSAAERCC
jgi:hypothetical protein